MNKPIGMDRYLKATVRLTLFANAQTKLSERELDHWVDELVELLERVNDQRFPKNLEEDAPDYVFDPATDV